MDNRVKTTWVVVAHQAGARFMEHKSGYGRHLTLVREIEHPDGRKRNHEIDSDKPGAASTSGRAGGSSPRAMQHEQTAHEHLATTFAHSLAAELSRSRAGGAFESLILVAEPGFLGLLREALDKPTSLTVVDSVNKNLASEQPNEVAAHIRDSLPL